MSQAGIIRNRLQLKITLLLFLFVNVDLLQAQGTGADGDLTVNGTFYIDNVHTTPLSDISTGNVSIPLTDCNGLNAGDKFLVIQMKGINAGEYVELEVNLINGNTVTINGSCSKNFYHDGITNFCQIVRIPQFKNLTIKSGGILTANSWDGISGGIIAFYVSEKLTIESNAIIDGNALGFRGGVAGSSGVGGAGGGGGITGTTGSGGNGGDSGVGGTGGNAGGLTAGKGGNGGASGQPGLIGFTGADGEGEGGGTIMISANNLTSIPLFMLPGGGGKGGDGGNGGNGAGGGGGGGKASLLSLGISAGATGEKGGDGGPGGKGGMGGGIIFIYADTISHQGIIQANGGDGENGFNGSNGGNGGKGGVGGSVLSIGGIGGGGGGGGNGANGGNGGEPGSGGAGGTVWIRANQILLFSGVTTAEPGNAGFPGVPGERGCGGVGGNGGSGLLANGTLGNGGICGISGSVINNSTPGSQGIVITPLNTPLPVNLLSFNANVVKNNSSVFLEWITATEINSKKFIVESSKDLKDFQICAEVAAAGNSNVTRKYNLTDNPEWTTETIYYRLKEVDINGNEVIFPVKSVEIEKRSNISVIPNPSKGRFLFEFEEPQSGIIIISDMKGTFVLKKQIHQEERLYVEGLKPGMYFYRLDSKENQVFEGKLIIEE